MQRHSFPLSLSYAPAIALLEYLDLSIEKMSILGLLLMIDYISGITKAFVIGEQIKSKRAIAGILSKLMVLTIPLVLAFMAKGIGIDAKGYVSYAIDLLIVAETYSIIGNIYSIKTGEKVQEIDAISIIIRALSRFLQKLLEGFKI